MALNPSNSSNLEELALKGLIGLNQGLSVPWTHCMTECTDQHDVTLCLLLLMLLGYWLSNVWFPPSCNATQCKTGCGSRQWNATSPILMLACNAVIGWHMQPIRAAVNLVAIFVQHSAIAWRSHVALHCIIAWCWKPGISWWWQPLSASCWRRLFIPCS